MRIFKCFQQFLQWYIFIQKILLSKLMPLFYVGTKYLVLLQLLFLYTSAILALNYGIISSYVDSTSSCLGWKKNWHLLKGSWPRRKYVNVRVVEIIVASHGFFLIQYDRSVILAWYIMTCLWKAVDLLELQSKCKEKFEQWLCRNVTFHRPGDDHA